MTCSYCNKNEVMQDKTGRIYSKCRKCMEKTSFINKMKRTGLNEIILYKEHIENKQFLKDIAKKYKVGMTFIRQIMKEYNIEEVKRCKKCGKEEDLYISSYKNNNPRIRNLCFKCFSKGQRINVLSKTVEELEKINNKKKNTFLKNYGVDHPLKLKETHKKIKQTKLERYGNKNYNNIEKAKRTMLDKYGVSCSFQIDPKGYSKISQELFWEIYKNLPIELKEKTYFAELNKEFTLNCKELNKNFMYDFVISNIYFCIEFHGIFWHAKMDLYDEDDYILDKKVSDIWDYDYYKQLYIENKNYLYMMVWEDEYINNKKYIVNHLLDGIYFLKKRYVDKIFNME